MNEQGRRPLESNPLFSIVMPMFQGEAYLNEAVQSVLAQTVGDWELLIIDDASTDRSPDMVKAFSEQDPRVRLLQQEQRLGANAARNRGLREARGRYIALLDVDDLCLPQRLERQRDFLQARPDVGLLGSSAIFIHADATYHSTVRVPETDEPIRWHEMTSRSTSFLNSSCVMRRAVLDQHEIRYDESLSSAQDKRMWFEVLGHSRGANLAEPLIRYRKHDQSITATRRGEQRTNAEAVCRAWMERTLGEPVDPDLAARMLAWRRPTKAEDLPAWGLCGRLLDAMEHQPTLSRQAIQRLRVQMGLRLLRYAPVRLWPALVKQGVLPGLVRGCGVAGVWRYAKGLRRSR
jgi:glycosyltransferase involved in cell wall biosynthesis